MGNLIRQRSLAREVAALRSDERGVFAEIAGTCDRIDEVDRVIRAFVPEPGRRHRLGIEARSIIERWTDRYLSVSKRDS